MNDLERINIERTCEQLQYSFARYIDFRDYEGFAELFCVDGVLNVGTTIKGRAGIFASCQKRPPGLRTRHVITNPFIEVLDDTTARGICYLTLYRKVADTTPANVPLPLSSPAGVGHYEDRFARTPDGWRIASRILHIAFRDDTQF
jgi:SnoaL-like domain